MAGKTFQQKIESALNRILRPIDITYGKIKKIKEKTKEKAPYIYDEIGSLIKDQLVTMDRTRGLLHHPDIDRISSTITEGIMRKAPNVNPEELKKIIENTSSSSFLDMLTRGLGCTIGGSKDYTRLSKEKIFRKVLIANRGEIALRIMRACRELGIKTVLVYSNEDKDGLAVRFADRAYNIGDASNYLNMDKIIKIAIKTKSDAIHPGYGFLAENPEFARLCRKNKIKFIGPNEKTIRSLGNKVQARASMSQANVPIVAGSKKLASKEEAIKIADSIGYPIILKAVAGGGGKGMRVVETPKALEKAFDTAKAEAKKAFGDDSLYLEKYVSEPKHIEFQILADQYGNVIHMYERDCSIQRRHQKLIEEAPSRALTPQLREKMGNAAVQAVKAVGYEGAGTVEFLLDKDNNFYFMEMNTRIQVEHGVTEMITGVVLIKEQIKIAAGAELSSKQEDISINGWAIECRINAESPLDDFSPSTGVVTNYLTPGGPGIRVCSSCHSGHIVSHHFDSLISKLICGGSNRNEAIARMKRALGEYIIDGVETTIPLHRLILSNKNFLKGKITTSFLEDNKIIEKLKKQTKVKKELSTEKKRLIVTTAVSKYVESRNTSISGWSNVARQEALNNEP